MSKNKTFKASHFENIQELLDSCKMWIRDDDYDAYCRFFDMGAMEELLNELEKKNTQINLHKKLYENLQQDFESYKNDKDINYLDRNHHQQLADKSIGQTIDKPEECWFDIFEVKVIKNNKLYGVAINDDFVNLKRISDEDPDNCITVIAESPLSGAIYRYNNNNQKEWQLIGTMLGYA